MRGVFVVTVFSFFLLFSVLTGFLFYKNWLKNLFKLRLGKGIRVLMADAHRMAGIWSLLFALIIAVTGIWYFTEFALNRAKSKVLRFEQPAKIAEAELATLGDNLQFVSLDVAVQKAEAAFPGYQVDLVLLPSQPDGYMVMHGQDKNPLTRDRTNQVHANPYTGEVVHIQKAADLSTLQLINNIVDPLHFGTFAGLGVKILWFIFGLVLSISILAGTYLWYLRHIQKLEGKINKLAKRKQRSEVINETSLPLVKAGFSLKRLGVGRGVIISTSLILFYLIGTGISTVTDGFRIWSGYPEGYRATIDDQVQLGPYVVELECTYPCNLEEGSTFNARFKNEGMANYALLSLDFIAINGDTIRQVFTGSANMPSVKMNEEMAAVNFQSAHLKVLTRTGNVFYHSVDLDRMQSIAADMKARFPTAPKCIYPEVPTRVYVVAALFTILTVVIILFWTVFILRAVWKEQRVLSLEAAVS
ncbi:MAG: PepSY-associated TM helix domain-containing protein, partial [Bacteroidota bacterium]